MRDLRCVTAPFAHVRPKLRQGVAGRPVLPTPGFRRNRRAMEQPVGSMN